jgi:hypothetical protein
MQMLDRDGTARWFRAYIGRPGDVKKTTSISPLFTFVHPCLEIVPSGSSLKGRYFYEPLRLDFYSLLGNHILAFAAEYLPYPSKALSLLADTI